MRVPKKLAIFGFNLSASVFLGLCVYGLLLYSKEGSPPAGSLLSSALYALAATGCIVGICFFGRQWDLRNAEEAQTAKEIPSQKEIPSRAGKTKKRKPPKKT
ncbi:MAG: hypothetical protein HKM86_00635 [Deltaproteobacteria bacterium]|nr:hypothetical protein [Deltaproteobacteria bacterium]